jgi:NDP-sugar pyrophosphorylase family protein
MHVTSEALILAGGLGTRLRAVVADRPKPLAQVAGRPFIAFLFEQLIRHRFQRAILCLGHFGELVPPLLGDRYESLTLDYAFERIPLGTAGALRNAADLVSERTVLVMNGDSFCDLDLGALGQAHRAFGHAVTMTVLQQQDRHRSGAVAIGEDGRVTAFESRPSALTPGLINAGVYMLQREVLDLIPAGQKVSLEVEVFPALVQRGELYAWQVEARFIDIGTPESYGAAQAFF